MKKKTRALLIDILGFSCIIIAPFLGWIPGPGGIPLLIIGLSLLANNHEWAEKLLQKVKDRTSSAASKVTEASPAVQWAIDIGSVILIAVAVTVITQATKSLITTAAISFIIAGVVLLATNQNRYLRLWNKFRSKHKQ